METMTAEAYRMLVIGGGCSPSRPRNKTPEEDLQRQCVQLAENLVWAHPLLNYLFHPANGGKRPKGEAGKLKALGVKPGVPDLILPFPSPSGRWPGMALELKSPEGRVSGSQNDWLYECQRHGWLTGTVRTLEEFQDYIDIFFS